MTQISTSAQTAREEARSSTTGRFGTQIHSQPEATLGQESVSTLLAVRREQLRTLGFVPAQPQLKLTETDSAAKWWERTQSIAEAGQYETMPRRWEGGSARLRTYENAEVSVRMPSAHAIRRFASEHGTTFDVPVEAATPHGPITGHVRVTSHGGGRYSVSAVQMPPEHGAYVAESVLSTLEARRPSRALSEVRDILRKRRERIASQGARLKPVESGWIRGVGYNPVDEQLVMDLQGRTYGYHVSKETYEEMMNARSLGSAYNALVKRVAPRYEVEQHEACGNWFYAGTEHRCPSYHEKSHLQGALATA